MATAKRSSKRSTFRGTNEPCRSRLQKEVLRLLAAQRSEASHIGGGIAINRDDASPRFSADVDIFHDVADAVSISGRTNRAT